MPTFLALLANASSPSLNFPHTPQPTIQFGHSTQNQWGPDSIGTIVFGFVMFFIGVVALWQGRARRLRREEDEEQGRRAPVGERALDLTEEVAMVDLSEGFGGARVAVGMDEQTQEDDTMEQGFVKIERARRTDTEGTLVGHEDEESEVKELEE